MSTSFDEFDKETYQQCRQNYIETIKRIETGSLVIARCPKCGKQYYGDGESEVQDKFKKHHCEYLSEESKSLIEAGLKDAKEGRVSKVDLSKL